jgi:hypothetical protein
MYLLSLVSTSLFFLAAAAETQLPLPQFFDPYNKYDDCFHLAF